MKDNELVVIQAVSLLSLGSLARMGSFVSPVNSWGVPLGGVPGKGVTVLPLELHKGQGGKNGVRES